MSQGRRYPQCFLTMRDAVAHSNRCAVAVLASHEVSGQAYVDYLSDREQARWATLRHPERQARWLAGRLAAKYLFLTQKDRAGTIGAGPPVFLSLTAERLASYLPRMYRHVEVLSQGAEGSSAPRLTWRGEACPAHRVSITHANGTTCACIAEGRALGIDLEEALHRIHAFYRGTFTKRERAWVTQRAGETQLSPTWLYTLLWTLKEAVLKANILERTISVWDFPTIDVQLRASPRELETASRQAQLGDRFLMGQVSISGPKGPADVKVAMTATRALILTILNS